MKSDLKKIRYKQLQLQPIAQHKQRDEWRKLSETKRNTQTEKKNVIILRQKKKK